MRPFLATAALATIALVLSPTASAALPVWIPPDGPAGPAQSVVALLHWAPLWSPVTTLTAKVVRVSCPNCDDATTAADFWISDGTGTVRVHVANTWQATYNVKKQNFVPAVNSWVVVQGRLQANGAERFVQMKRFGERDHWGPTVHAYDVARGRYPTETYVWLDPVRVLNVGFWDDGDTSYDVRDLAGGGFVHVEATPPYMGLRSLHQGDIVQPYGMIRYDPDHGWWELHPARCWSHSECVPLAASYVRSGPPPGTPTATNGWYLQGGPVPMWVPVV